MSLKEDISVSFQDQQNINNFAKWNGKMKEYERFVETREKALANLTDLEDELIAYDEPYVQYRIGDCFFHITADEATTKVEEQKKSIKEKLIKDKNDLANAKSESLVLKKALYDKFGDHINLEEK